jgi:glycosyltransferase involved in cell wall biosynthesis
MFHRSVTKNHAMFRRSVCVVTPSFNSAATIDETIESVVRQRGSFDLHYHVQDGGSRDGTVEKLKQWQTLLDSGALPHTGVRLTFTYSVERDAGMYDGINRGFSAVSGEIMSWINSDDRLEPAALQTICDAMENFPDCHWITGRVSLIRSDGIKMAESYASAYNQTMIASGLYDGLHLNFIQQEGTFWRRALWEACGARLDSSLKLAGDYDLWIRMANHAALFAVDANTASFRKHAGQKTTTIEPYLRECDTVRHNLNERAVWERYSSGELFRGPVLKCVYPGGRWERSEWAAGPATPTSTRLVYVDKVKFTSLCGFFPSEGPWPEAGLFTRFQWMGGGRAAFSLDAPKSGRFRVSLSYYNFLVDQRIHVFQNGRLINSTSLSVTDDVQVPPVVFTVMLAKGTNMLEVAFDRISSSGRDPRPLCAALLRCDIFETPEIGELP